MNKSFLTILIFLVITFYYPSVLAQYESGESALIIGERIDGPANIREDENGEVVFSLNDWVQVDNGGRKGDWFEVGIWVSVNREQANSSKILPSSNLLIDGKVIGHAIDTVDILTVDKNWGYIYGYTYKSNIRKETIPEEYLSSLISKGQTLQKDLGDLISTLDFERDQNWSNMDLDAYYIYEPLINDMSPLWRIVLLFKDENLVAIMHKRYLDLPNWRKYDLKRGYKLTVIGDLADREINDLITERNEFFGAID